MESPPKKSTFLQEGSYGCVFTPPLPCKKAKGKTLKTVGKIMKKKNAVSEIGISNTIKDIEGYERYFLIQEVENCDKKNFQELRESYEDSCEMMKKQKDNTLVQLVSPYGGVTLFSYPITQRFDYIGVFRHVLEGIVKLQKKGICHYDLHESNIVLDYKGTARLIDFGSAFIGPEIKEDQLWRHQYNFEPDYPPQPPELSVQNALYDKISLREGIHETLEQKEIVKLKEKILGVRYREQYDELYTFWTEEDEAWDGKEWHPFFRAYWKKIDAWSVGVIFLKLLPRLFFFREFEHTVWSKHGETIKRILRGLLHMSPIHRYSPEIALSILKSLY